ncbi:MAG: acyl carrier protein [Candidatus Rokubacteria bacterium]|nr:acyl carrier protein [Candidatus Rokubacteria bacterium]
MSDTNGFQARLTRLVAEKMHLEIPSPDTDLFESGALDSLGFVDLLLHLEQEFGVTVNLDTVELDDFRSIARLARYLAYRNDGGRPGRE